jgi:glucose/arabinose dehydrogenase
VKCVALLLAVGLLAGCGGRSQPKRTVYATGLTHVSALTFDGNGRLWATVSGAQKHKGDGVYVVERRGAKPRKVIAGLTAPLGLVWVGDQLIVSSLGRVTAYSGFDGTRFVSSKVILDGPVAGGENNNIVLAPNGRLVMGVSASCDACVPASKYSAAIVTFKPDGSDLRVYASRIRAAYGLTFVPGTSELLASMNQRDDLGSKTPGDWLAIVRAGQNWGFPNCYGQCAGQPKPLGVLDAHAAAGGVAVLDADTAVVAEWQLGRVMRVSLKDGATSVHLTGLENPLALLTTGAGSLLVGDWGSGVVYEIAER